MQLVFIPIVARCHERSLFMLEWLRDPSLRRRVKIGLEQA
jgi:TnpA family transposase